MISVDDLSSFTDLSGLAQSHDNPVLFTIFLIFFGAAIVAALALYARQAMLVSYIVLGVLLGPAVFGVVQDAHLVEQIADIGIIFLLFLLGLNLPPQKLQRLVAETTWVTLLSTAALIFTCFFLAWLFGFSMIESLVIAVAMIFSSTIIGLKLLPTTVLHHQHTGGMMISILLLQDVLAIGALLLLQIQGTDDISMLQVLLVLVSFPALFLFAHIIERFVLTHLIRKFDRIQEFMFLMAIAWCLAMAELAAYLGLSYEIGAFIAGVSLARHPISMFIAESLKPLRDFFLIIFFFSIGTGFTPISMQSALLPALVLAGFILWFKPYLFGKLLVHSGEKPDCAKEIGIRLGQLSEFSILIAILALEINVIGSRASDVIQLATVATLMISPYLIITRYPSPMAISDHLRRD